MAAARRPVFRSQELGSTGETMAMLWVLNFSDGKNTLMDIAERATLPIDLILNVAAILESHGLLKKLM